MLAAEMSSFADLTPVSLTASSSTTDEIPESVTRTKVNEFNRLVAELGFGGEDDQFVEEKDEIQFLNSPNDQESSDDEDEDVQIRYPYQRKDQFIGLEERLTERLERTDVISEADEELYEIEQLVQAEKEKRKQQTFTVGSIFSCVICAKAFPDAETLQEHTNKSHDLSRHKYKCNLCGKTYKHFKNLEAHKALHLAEFGCPSCNMVFQSATTRANHITRHHSEAVDDHETINLMKRCHYCEKRYPEETLAAHMWYCKNKERILAKKAEKKKALSVPPSPAMSTASYASFTSLQPGPSYSPVVSPSVSVRDKSCQVCGESFASRQSMLRHVGRRHPEKKNDANVTAVRYVSTESPTHPYACTDCGKRLTTRAALTQHRARAHQDNNRNSCPHCDKAYAIPSELRKHIQRVHVKPGKGAAAPLPDLADIF